MDKPNAGAICQWLHHVPKLAEQIAETYKKKGKILKIFQHLPQNYSEIIELCKKVITLDILQDFPYLKFIYA